MQNLRDRDFIKEIYFKTSASGGPGGQHVNKVNTKVELRFNVDNSQLLSDDEKQLIREKLATRITKNGELRIVSQKERSQLQNKEIVIQKFFDLLQIALIPEKERIPTKTPIYIEEKRLIQKKRTSEKKENRKNIFDIE